MRSATQDQFLGALLGMAIGDALGMPVDGWAPGRIAERFGRIEWYHRRVFPDGAEIKAGEFTDESEIALCIVESLTTNEGRLDLDNVAARMQFLARGEAHRWIHPDTLAALDHLESVGDVQVPLDEDGPVSAELAARGIPVGLLYAVGRADDAGLRLDAESVVRLTHGSPLAISLATATALAVNHVARNPADLARLPELVAGELGTGSVAEALLRADRLTQEHLSPEELVEAIAPTDAPASVVASAIALASLGLPLLETVLAAVNAGGATESRAAVAGAIAGTAVGSAGIPQKVIDDLEARIYVSLAGPWFYRAAQRRGGHLIELTPEPPSR